MVKTVHFVELRPRRDEEGGFVLGVFSSYQKALEFAKRKRASALENLHLRNIMKGCELKIQEREVR